MKQLFGRYLSVFFLLTIIAVLVTGCSVKARRDRLLAKAQTYFTHGDYDRAEIEFLNALRLDTGSSTAIEKLGILYFDQGRYSKAIPYLLKARELSPNDLDVRLRLGKTFLAGGRNKEARVEIDYVLEHNLADPEASLVFVQTATAKTGDADVVRTRLTQLLQTNPGNAALHVALGTLDLRLHHFDDAREQFDQAQRLEPNSSAVLSALGSLYQAKGNLPLAEESFARAAELAPDRSLSRLQYARFGVQINNLAAAHASLGKIIKKTPDFIPAGALLAEVFLAENKPEQAVNVIDRLLARDPANLEVLILSSRASVVRGQPEKATATMDKARNLYPQSPQAHFNHALTLVAQKKPREAASSLNQTLALDPEFTEASLLLAGVNMLRNDHAAAIAILKTVLQKHPELMRAQTMLADAYRSHGDLDGALRLYEGLEKRYTEKPEFPLARGLVLTQQGHYDEARGAFNHVLQLSPDSMSASEQLLNLDLKDKHYEAARARAQQLIARRPEAPEPLLFLARTLLAQSDVSAATAALERAIAIQPEFQPAYLILAQVYAENHEEEKALERLRLLAAKTPGDVTALMMIGTLCERQQQFPSAREAYEKLLVIAPRFSPALNNLAYLYAEKFNELGKASELGRKARELRPSDPTIADTYGWILYKKGEYAHALTLLQESAGKVPEDPELQAHLGLALYMSADEQPACNTLQRALSNGSSFPGAEQARDALAILLLPLNSAAGPTLEKRLASKPDDPVASLRLAQLHEQNNDAAGARNVYQSLIAKYPQDTPALIGLARLLQKQGIDQAKAFDLAKAAYRLTPDDPEVAHTLGQLAYSAGECKWAVSLLQAAAAKQTGDSTVLFDLATAEYSTGMVDEAAGAMRDALQTADSAFSRADEARRFIELLAIEADPNTSANGKTKIEEALNAYHNFLPALAARAALAEQAGDVRTAITTCEDILIRQPAFKPAVRRLALLLSAGKSDEKRATDLLYKARESYPSDPRIARGLGLAAFRAGDFPRALTFLTETSARFSDDAEVFYCLGLTQNRLKDRAGAQQSLLRALALAPKNNHADEAQQILNQPR